ncbi:MAG: DUF4870 domain-containing protein [Aureliella sp.]
MNLPLDEREQQVRLWGMIMHLSQLANFLLPVAGFIIPIVIWQMKKNEYPELDAHGKIIANWLLSSLIYGFVSVLLVFVLVGIPLLLALGLAGIVFPIIGGIKANSGEIWKYPLCITFFR